jgi:hypothetical protein
MQIQMQSITIQDIQKVTVTALPQDDANGTATNFNAATWVVTDTDVATVSNVSSDGLTADIVSAGIGSTTVTVTGQQGNFMPQYSTAFTVTVTAALPTHFAFTFGTPVNK